MRLYKLNYRQNFGSNEKNPWEIKDLILRDQNLIIGRNATGKTRTVHVINNFAKVIMGKVSTNGHWSAEFFKGKDIFFIELLIEGGIVKKEEIKINNDFKLKRNSKAQIFSEKEKNFTNINPPQNELVLRKRDVKDYPFLEDLFHWASNVKGYLFGDTNPQKILVPSNEADRLISLDTAPTVLAEMSEVSIQKVIDDFNQIGYGVESAKSSKVQHEMLNLKMIEIKEKNLTFNTGQFELSQGMFRAFALLVMIQYILDSGKEDITILVDDLGEGLDYERSIKFTKLVFEKTKAENLQLIATTNDEYAADSVELENINVLERDGSTVRSYNYENSKEGFDEFKSTGLGNFDLFSSNFLLSKKQ